MYRLRSKKFEAIIDCTVYKDQPDGYANEPHPVRAGAPFEVTDDNETRTLDDGRVVQAVLLMLSGSTTWCWMPKDEFLRSTKKI
jgi:hypothetical protein